MNMIEILEKKINKKFLGTTGNDLKEFLDENCECFLDDHYEIYELTEDEYEPEVFYIEMANEKGMLLDGISFDEVLNFDDETNEFYCTLERVCYESDQDPLVKGYLDDQNKYTVKSLVEMLHKLCKENNTHATLSFDDYSGREVDLYISFNGDDIKYEHNIIIEDNNSESFIIPYVWLAYRARDMKIDEYLAHANIKYLKSDDYKDELNKRLDKLKTYDNLEDIKAQINRTPASIANYELSVIENEEVAITFVEAENNYVEDRIKVHYDSDKDYHYNKEGLIHIGLNDFKPVSSILSMKYILKHKAYLDKLAKTHLAMLITADDETIDETISLLKPYPILISAVMDYYVDKMSDPKFKEHCLRKYRLEEDTIKSLIAIRIVEEIIERTNRDCYVCLLSIPKPYIESITEYLNSLPMDLVRRAIKENYNVMNVYKNSFDVDDPLVLEILKNKAIASNVLSDEAIIKYNLKDAAYYGKRDLMGNIEKYYMIFSLYIY